MKNLFTAILFSILFAGVCLAQPNANVAKSDKPRIAVLEFNAEPKASSIGAAGTQTLQNGVAQEVRNVNKVDAIAIKQSHSAAIRSLYQDLLGRPVDSATAVRIGKLLGVNYVMTGSVTEYGVTDKGARLALRAQLIKVDTGDVVWSSTGDHSDPTLTKELTGTLVLNSKSLTRPAIQKLTASLKAADL